MSSIRARIARLAAASALTLALGSLGAGPTLADGPGSWNWSVPDSSHHGIHAVEESPNGQMQAI